MTARPRLLIDLSAAFNQGAGIGRYARNLVGAAAHQLGDDFQVAGWYAPDPSSGDRFHSLAIDALGDLGRDARRSRVSRRRIDQLWFRLPLASTARVLVRSAPMVYSPDFTAPPVRDAATVVTVHDLAFLKAAEHCPEPLRRYLTAVVPRQVERADRVVVVSEATRRDVLDTYGVDPARVSVIPNAADERFFTATALPSDDRAKLGIPERYLMTVGTLEPRKNHRAIFEAMDVIYRESGVPMVVVGRNGWANEEIRRSMNALVERGAVVDATNVGDVQLARLYAGAAAVVQLSWYEGFGIPVIEAMAAGAPVVASDIPAHREVAGCAAVLVAPGDTRAVADAALSIIEGDHAHDAEAGRIAARRFSWERSGTMLAMLLSEVNDGR